MKVIVNIAGLDAMTLATPMRRAPLDALRARIAFMRPPRDDQTETSAFERHANIPNVPPQRGTR